MILKFNSQILYTSSDLIGDLMNKTTIKHKKIAGFWLLIAPTLVLMALFSTVKSETSYYVQLTIFSTIALVAFISAVEIFLNSNGARRVLRVVSWLVVFYAVVVAIVMLVYSIRAIFNVGISKETGLVVVVAFGVGATWGIPFTLLARGLKKIKINEEVVL